MNNGETAPCPSDLVVVGGGLAGLAAAALVARAGRTVAVVEQAKYHGGRAVTHVQEGAHFNLGPHALYCRGHASRLFRELEVPFTGNFPNPGHSLLFLGDESYRLPAGLGTLIGSRLLTVREKVRFVRILTTLPRLDARRLDGVPLGDWIERTAGSGNAAAFLGARSSEHVHRRLGSPVGGSGDRSVAEPLEGNVWYIDGGWQTLVDGLCARAIEHGASVRTGARVQAVVGDENGVSVHLSGGDVLRGRAAVLAVAPRTACELLDLPADAPLCRWASNSVPVKAACLDVVLDRLPRPGHRFALGLDRPFYFSVHSAAAKLAPEGTVVLHVMKYLGEGGATPVESLEWEIEGVLDQIQPGWRSCTITRRFLPGMTVAHSLPRADEGGLSGRPAVPFGEQPNVFLAGDWVGPEGMLADAVRRQCSKPPPSACLPRWRIPPSIAEGAWRMSRADAIFEEHRPALARLAYRMLGSLADADDVLQDAYLRWTRRQSSRGGVAAGVPLLDRDTPVHRSAPAGRGSEADVRGSVASRAGCRARGRRPRTAGSTPPRRCRWRCCWSSRACLRSSGRRICCDGSSTSSTRDQHRSWARRSRTAGSSSAAPSSGFTTPPAVRPRSRRRPSA